MRDDFRAKLLDIPFIGRIISLTDAIIFITYKFMEI